MDLKTLEEYRNNEKDYRDGDLAKAFEILQDYAQQMTEAEFKAFLIEQSKYVDGFGKDFQKYLEERQHLSDDLIFEMETLTIYLYQEMRN